MTRQKQFGQTIVKDRNGKPVRAMTQGQYELSQAIDKYDVLFVNGPAGTGKTFLAACKAIAGLQEGKYDRVCITRPAMESGEELGFLPGSLEDKIAPYMRPLYESIDKLKPKPKKVAVDGGAGKGKRKRGSKEPVEYREEEVEWAKRIEVAPLAYMRGITMENSFIILDEAQNVTPSQMKLFLTRIGWNSKVVITGDASQSDMARRSDSGFRHAQKLLKGIEGLGFVHLKDTDIVRHRIVRDIIKKYEKADSYRNHVMSNRDNDYREDYWEEKESEYEAVPDDHIETYIQEDTSSESYNGCIDISKLDD